METTEQSGVDMNVQMRKWCRSQQVGRVFLSLGAKGLVRSPPLQPSIPSAGGHLHLSLAQHRGRSGPAGTLSGQGWEHPLQNMGG